MGVAGERLTDPQGRGGGVRGHCDHGLGHAMPAESRWPGVGDRGAAVHRVDPSAAPDGGDSSSN